MKCIAALVTGQLFYAAMRLAYGYICQKPFNMQLQQVQHIFFIGVAGTGMSALAQFLSGSGKSVSGSDRYFKQGEMNETRTKLEAAGIQCFEQDGSGISAHTQLVVVSTAVEDTVPEVQKAMQLNIPIIKRSALLALIAKENKTIAVGGTSGKSTTTAMLFAIMQEAGYDPGIISGAGLVSLIQQGLIGNAWVGKSGWLVIEADESDGSIVQYEPYAGLLLNIDKDHQEIDQLKEIFGVFQQNTQQLFSVNRSHSLAAAFSVNPLYDFAVDASKGAGFTADNFQQEGLTIQFTINGVPFSLQTVGKHNMENALAAAAMAANIGIPLETASKALSKYIGIYRRHQLLAEKNGVWVIDDYAHNPAKCAASIQACQAIAPKVIAWFQPHGYGPTRFLRHDFVHEIAAVLRPEDQIWMSEIFYAGGTAVKDISAGDLINDIQQLGKQAFFVPDRADLLESIRPHLSGPTVLLLMGARDPSLEYFAQELASSL